MGQAEFIHILLAVWTAFYLTVGALYQLMVFRVNKFRPPETRLSHLSFAREWSTVAKEYKNLYPQGVAPRLTLACTVTVLTASLLLVLLRFRG